MIDEAFSTNSFNVVCGRMGQGKTSLVTSLVKSEFNKCFETIYVFMSTNNNVGSGINAGGSAVTTNSLGGNGGTNTGGGGGGFNAGAAGGNGGSGIVIIAFPQ